MDRLIEQVLEVKSIENIRALLVAALNEIDLKRNTYSLLKNLAVKNFQRCAVGEWNSEEPIKIDVYDQPLRIAFTFFNCDRNAAEKWVEQFAEKNDFGVVGVSAKETPVHYDLKVSDYSSKIKPLDGVNLTLTYAVDTTPGNYKLACGIEYKKVD